MPIDRKNKQLRIRLEDLWIHFWLPVLIFFLGSFWVWNQIGTVHRLEVEYKTEKRGVMQLFVDDGSGFSEENSFKHEVTVSEKKSHVEFDLSGFEKVQTLRFDPINNDGYFVLCNISYQRLGNWRKTSLLKSEYAVANGVRWKWNAKDAELEIYPEVWNQDPHFLLEGDYTPLRDEEIFWKRVGFHGLSLLLGISVYFGFRPLILSVLVWVLRILQWPKDRLGAWAVAYTKWINQISLRWGAVNPTSCLFGGILAATLSWFYFIDMDLFESREERMQPCLCFTMTEGDAVPRMYGYLVLEGQSKYRGFQSQNDAPLEPGDRVMIPLKAYDQPVKYIRVDPIEGKGVVGIQDLQIRGSDGRNIPMTFKGWKARRNTSLELLDEDRVLVRSTGEDPQIISSELGLSLPRASTLSVYVMAPLVVCFFVTVGLLLYNRMMTESMTREQIRSLQKH